MLYPSLLKINADGVFIEESIVQVVVDNLYGGKVVSCEVKGERWDFC